MEEEDLLEKVELTSRAVVAYREFALRLASMMVDLGIHPGEVSEERAYQNDKGGLVIYVDLPRSHGRIEFTIPPEDWAWQNRN